MNVPLPGKLGGCPPPLENIGVQFDFQESFFLNVYPPAPLILSKLRFLPKYIIYSETRNNEYIERIHQMSYSSLSDNGMLQIFSFLIK